MRLSIVVDNEKNAELLKAWLQHIDFVQCIEGTSISWSLPGVPVNDKEIQQMLDDCMECNDGMECNDFFNTLK